MENFFRTLIGWKGKSEAEQRALRNKIDAWRYPLLTYLAAILSIFPIPLRFWLRISLSDKHRPGYHLYGQTYGRLFSKFKYRRIKILEIGIGGYDDRLGGQSLNAWQGYFPFAQIVGCDIQDKSQLKTFRTKIYQLDQSSKRDLDLLCENEKAFDIIIDDGSHLNRDQIFTFNELFPFLNEGGIYVIEDVQTSYWPFGEWDGAAITDPRFQDTCVGYFLRLTPYLNYMEFEEPGAGDTAALELARCIKQIIFEHNLIIIMKGDNTEPSHYLSGRHQPY